MACLPLWHGERARFCDLGMPEVLTCVWSQRCAWQGYTIEMRMSVLTREAQEGLFPISCGTVQSV
jgi:hypothetical protein